MILVSFTVDQQTPFKASAYWFFVKEQSVFCKYPVLTFAIFRFFLCLEPFNNGILNCFQTPLPSVTPTTLYIILEHYR